MVSAKARAVLGVAVLPVIAAFPLLLRSQTTVLKGATVITGSGGPPIPNAVVVIEADKIAAVGGSEAPFPAGATVVDVTGKFIIPGLVESHSHYEEWMGEVMLNYGVTTALAVGGNFGRMKEASYQSTARSPRIYDTAGGPRLAPSMNEQQIRESVREWLRAKPDFARIGDYDSESRPYYAWAADEVHRAGLLVFGHTENAPESIRAGHDVVEHIWGFVIPFMSKAEHEEFQAGRYLHWSTFLRDWPRLEEAIRDAVAQGAYLNATLVYELGSLSIHAERHEREAQELYGDAMLMAYYPQGIAHSLVQKKRQIRNFSNRYENLVLLSRLTPADRAEFQRGYQLALQFVKRFVDAGGKIQAGTDTISGGTPGLTLHHEMDLLVEAGLTPMQALQSATLWSGEKLAGKNGRLGKPKVGWLAPGTFADLVVLSANPLEGIGNTRRIERVMKGGRFVEPGYDPAYFSFTRPPRKISMATPVPEISDISPHTVLEGSGDFEITIRGVGFTSSSVVKVDNVAVPTAFVNSRVIKAKIRGELVRSAAPNPFDAPGPLQHTGIFGDRTLVITVYNAPPEGGLSGSVSLRVRAQWMGLDPESQ